MAKDEQEPFYIFSLLGLLLLLFKKRELISVLTLEGFGSVTMNQNVYFEGVFLVSSSMATAMTNLIPAVTFVIATIVG